MIGYRSRLMREVCDSLLFIIQPFYHYSKQLLLNLLNMISHFRIIHSKKKRNKSDFNLQKVSIMIAVYLLQLIAVRQLV